MAITVISETFLTAVKVGLTKVKDANASIALDPKGLLLQFNSPSVSYSSIIQCSGSGLQAASFDAASLLKLLKPSKSHLEISQDGPEIKFKQGKSILKLAASVTSSYLIDEDIDSSEPSDASSDTFRGWTKNHPLYNALTIKKSLQAIKDNITKSELVVEAQWGKGDVLKIKIVDQFHGILCITKLESSDHKKKINIRLPLSSFLLLMDIKGNLYVDHSKVIVKNKNEQLTCKFIAGSAYGTIDDMMQLVGVKPQVECDAKELASIVKRIATFVENDDPVIFKTKGKNLIVSSSAIKGSLKEAILSVGNLESVTLPPKNLYDITACINGKVGIADTGKTLVFCSTGDRIVTYGALVKLG